MKSRIWFLCSLFLLSVWPAFHALPVSGQTRGSMTVFGDVKVDESKAGGTNSER